MSSDLYLDPQYKEELTKCLEAEGIGSLYSLDIDIAIYKTHPKWLHAKEVIGLASGAIPYEDAPLYINEDPRIRALCKWRLKIRR